MRAYTRCRFPDTAIGRDSVVVTELPTVRVARSNSIIDPPYPLPANVTPKMTRLFAATRTPDGVRSRKVSVMTACVLIASLFRSMKPSFNVPVSPTTSVSPPSVTSIPVGRPLDTESDESRETASAATTAIRALSGCEM